MITDINSEDRLVQKTFAEHLDLAGTFGGDVLQLFKILLLRMVSPPSFKIAGKTKCNFVVSILGFLHFLPSRRNQEQGLLMCYDIIEISW